MGFLKRLWRKATGAAKKMKSKFDKCGSYTGTLDDEISQADDKPEQDADDL